MPDILTRADRSDYDECAYFHEAAQMYCGGLRKDHGTRYTGHQFTPEPPLGRLQIAEIGSDHGQGASEGSQRNLTQAATAPETIRISLPGLSDAESDRLRQIQKEVAERPSDESAMQSACGEYNCPCHYQIGFLLEVIAKTTTISLPALRSLTMGVLDSKALYLQHLFHADEAEANEAREMFCDGLEAAIREVQGRFNG